MICWSFCLAIGHVRDMFVVLSEQIVEILYYKDTVNQGSL